MNTRAKQNYRLMLAQRKAAEGIQLLSNVAKMCEDSDLRLNAIRLLAVVGTDAAAALVKLLDDPERRDEVRRVAGNSFRWPCLWSEWPSDQKHIEALLPRAELGKLREVAMGNSSLDVAANKWAFAFIQNVQFCRVAWERSENTGEAVDYVKAIYGIDVTEADMVANAKLRKLSMASLDAWKRAFKQHVERHFPNYSICETPDWKPEAANAAAEGKGRLGGNPKKFQNWILGRVNRALKGRVQG